MTHTRYDHWHVHQYMPGGYLCDCDFHYPLSARGRDETLREERDYWREYAATVAPQQTIHITGSIRSGGFYIDDIDAIAWCRAVESWPCGSPGCWEDIES